ncbi:tyrosine-type recombinase/integrase [Microbulbifer salipaludis]|uniref:Tyrosine-type recombinase/integrase n=1 Tax=Microbulbifer salipaludis TaxID=187980 RepID=A0ABS3E9W0_9GAMM|nr:tyrosine-type recombinase/integrase [Microbulbifer salipaludis]MBN8431849.1 tyrosine-type recombinase/integrase [Microbulbifer salipaludis]
MGRQRNPENAWMPPYVERYKGGYRVKRRGHGTCHLAAHDASKSEVWSAYESWQADQVQKTFTVADLIDNYFSSPQYTKHLKPSTQQDYDRYSKQIRVSFGEMSPDAITSPLVQMYMDARGSQYPTAANRERTFLGIIMKWGKARGFVSIEDPTDAVRPFKEEPGGRYVEDWEYEAFWHWLGRRGHTVHQCAMEIAYLCAARHQDVIALTRADIQEDGLLVYQQKTGKKQLKLWTPRLREAVDLALATNTHAKIQSAHILRSRTGRAYTRTGFNAIWQREQRAALEAEAIQERFRFHDLKIKAASDFDGDVQQFTGHKTRSMAERYNRTPDRVTSLERPRRAPVK